MTARIELRAGAAAVTLVPSIGGAIAGFTLHGADVMRPMPEEAIVAGNVHLAAAYPLVPYSNRIRDASLEVRGTRYLLRRNAGDQPNAMHGVGWQRPWTVEHADAASALLALTHAAEVADTRNPRVSWPWAFRATQSYALQERDGSATLAVTMTLRNDGAEEFPFGLGWHPYFPKQAATTLQFIAANVWINDSTQLPVERTPIPPQWDYTTARPIGDPDLDNVFTGWHGVAQLESSATGLRTMIEADTACTCAVVYAPRGRDYLAVEPVTHETDAFNRLAKGEKNTGTRWLPPGAAFSCTMRISVEPLVVPRHAT